MSVDKETLDRWTEYAVQEMRAVKIREAYETGFREGFEEVYKKEYEEGLQRMKFILVRNLLKSTKFKVSEVANIAGVTESFVKKVQASIKKGK